MKRIMVTGALGQIGSELVPRLREIYGADHVLATDIREKSGIEAEEGPFSLLDVTDGQRMAELAEQFRADAIIHLAALLSATAEKNPLLAWNLNMGGLLNALEVARLRGASFFTPSSIGAFGGSTPKVNTPQVTIQRPTTMYGVNKVSGELLADYYFHKYGVDTRSLRFPGLISYRTAPGGGTTDYAVEIYEAAVAYGEYTSYIAEGTLMDMMYMPDAIDAVITLMEADGGKLRYRNAYNVTAMSLAPEMIAEEIRRWIPGFNLSYQVDPVRQAIADSWPDSLDASAAKEDWGFKPIYDLPKMTEEMIRQMREKHFGGSEMSGRLIRQSMQTG